MVGECQEYLQGISSHLLELRSRGLNHHTIFCQSGAGRRIVIQAFYRDDAQLAGADGLQVRMIAKRWNVRARFSGSFQNSRSLWNQDLSVIDNKFNL